MPEKEFIKTFKDEVNRLLVEQEYQKKKAEIDTAFQNNASVGDGAYQQALYNLEVNKNNYLNFYDYFLPENNYKLPTFGNSLQSSTIYSLPLINNASAIYPVNNLTVDYPNFSFLPTQHFFADELEESEELINQEIDLPDFSFSFTSENQNNEGTDIINKSDTMNESNNKENSMIKLTEDIPQSTLLGSLIFNEPAEETNDTIAVPAFPEAPFELSQNLSQETMPELLTDLLPEKTDDISLLTTLNSPALADVTIPELTAETILPTIISEMPTFDTEQTPVQNIVQTFAPQEQTPVQSIVQTSAPQEQAPVQNIVQTSAPQEQAPVQNIVQTSVPQEQIPVQVPSSDIQTSNTLQTLSGVSQPTTFYKTDISPQQKSDEKTAAFAHEQKKNMMVRAAEWVQENIFDAVGNHIPLIGTVIKMIGNVFTGFFKTIGNLFDGNFGNALSSGLSWLKDSAIIGGSAYGIYKLGKEFNWWGKKNSTTSSSIINQNAVEDAVQGMVQDAVINAVTKNAAGTTQNIISGIATPVPENTSTNVLQNLALGKLNQYDN